MRKMALAAAVAVAAACVSLASQAAAATVIYSITGNMSSPTIYYTPLPGEGTYDITLEASRIAGFSLTTSFDNHVDIYRAPPAYPHDSNLITGSNSEARQYQDFYRVTSFAYTLVVPPDTGGSFLSDSYYTSYGIPIGTTLYSTVTHGNVYARLMVSPLVGDPLDYTFTITKRDAAVPEPASWALMILGFGAVGSAVRGRRRAVLKA